MGALLAIPFDSYSRLGQLVMGQGALGEGSAVLDAHHQGAVGQAVSCFKPGHATLLRPYGKLLCDSLDFKTSGKYKFLKLWGY